MIQVRKVLEEDITALVADIRIADKIEVELATGLSVDESVRLDIKNAYQCAATYIDGDLVCIFGLYQPSLLSNIMMPWMYGTNKIHQHKKQFWKASKEIIGRMTHHAEKLENYVHQENKLAIAWLKRGGFTFGDVVKLGDKEALFVRFELCVQQ